MLLYALTTLFFLPYFAYALPSAPLATVQNGTYAGTYLTPWNQDAFLGIPYAQPPVGPLRFAWPRSLNASFSGVRDASRYGYSCYQYGSNFNLSEDCLTLNGERQALGYDVMLSILIREVVRPTGTTSDDKLPVLVWIYGGGLYAGSTADPQYNISGIAHVSQDVGKPMITVSLNYRLGVWGFLQSPQVLAEGSANAGLLDQRMALRWIKENIAAFGGDAERITVWGESAGAQSIAYQMFSYDGRDDGLYHAAILESGSYRGAQVQPLAYYNAAFENLTRANDCWTSSNRLACLRNVSSDALFKAQVSEVWNPMWDGDFLTAPPSELIPQGKFVHVPILIGANTDEGSSFGVSGLDNETAIFQNLLAYRTYAITPPSARKILELYPNDPAHEVPFHVTNATIFPTKGLQWRRDATIAGDIVIIGARRHTAEFFTAAGLPVYSYRFDNPLWNASITDGAKHFVNVVFSFQNISGALGPLPQFQSYADLSHNIGKAYVSFVNDQTPNPSGGNGTLPYWPRYNLSTPQNLVLNSNGSYVEADDFRKAGIDFLNTIDRELLA